MARNQPKNLHGAVASTGTYAGFYAAVGAHHATKKKAKANTCKACFEIPVGIILRVSTGDVVVIGK